MTRYELICANKFPRFFRQKIVNAVKRKLQICCHSLISPDCDSFSGQRPNHSFTLRGTRTLFTSFCGDCRRGESDWPTSASARANSRVIFRWPFFTAFASHRYAGFFPIPCGLRKEAMETIGNKTAILFPMCFICSHLADCLLPFRRLKSLN
jgi:hypothetical protein